MLSAGHMKHLTSRLANVAFHHTASAIPFPWGVHSHKIDADKIAQGVFALVSVDAVLPDGQIISLDSQQPPISIQLPTDQPDGEELNVCIGKTPTDDLAYQHFTEIQITESDDQTIPITVYKSPISLAILEKGEALGNRLIIARIRCQQGRFLSIDYFPPTLQIEAGSDQWRYINAVLSDIQKALWKLVENHRDSKPANRVSKLEYRFFVQSLSAGLLVADARLKANPHPFHIYLDLCSILGHVDHLRGEDALPILKPFDHAESYTCFQEVITHIRIALEEIIGGHYKIHVFEGREDSFRIVMREDWIARPLTIAVAAENHQRQLEVTRWMMDCLIESADRLGALKQMRTIGGKRTLISSPPANMVSPDRVFFSVDVANLQAGDELVLANHTGHDPAPESVELLVAREHQGEQ